MPVFMKSGGKGIAARGEEAAGRDAAHALRERAGRRGDPRHGAGRRLRDRGAFGAGASRRWKATWAWSKSASAWCPGGGGLTYIARRAAEMAAAGHATSDLLQFLTDGFTAAAMAKVGTERDRVAQARLPAGQRRRSCRTRTNCCTSRSQQAKAMFDARLPRAAQAPVPGRRPQRRSRRSRRQLVNMRDGGFISAHDFHIASLIADVVCGGDVDAGTLVTEEYLMTLERKPSARCSTTRRRRNGSWACCRPASRCATDEHGIHSLPPLGQAGRGGRAFAPPAVNAQNDACARAVRLHRPTPRRRFWSALAASPSQLAPCKFRRQHPTRCNYIADFACLETEA